MRLVLSWLALAVFSGIAACDTVGQDQVAEACSAASPDLELEATSCASDSVSMGPGGYCSGGADNVTCSVDNNVDNLWEHSGDSAQTIRGDVVALPISTRESSVDGGRLSVTSQEPGFTDGRRFWMWVSETPGGPALTGPQCSQFMARARGGMYWTQNPRWVDGERICYLGSSAKTLYLNFTACETDGVACAGPIASRYEFSVRRSYKSY